MNKRKKIFFLVSNLTIMGGTQRVTQILSNYFVEQLEYEVGIICIGKKNGEEKFHIDKRVKIYYCNHENKENNFINIIGIYSKVKHKTKEISKELKGSIVISMGIGLSYIMPYAFYGYSCKLVGMQHNVFKSNCILNIVRRYLINKLDVFVTINELMKIDTINKLKTNNIICIENPLTFYSEEVTLLNNNRLIAVGRLVEQKGFDLLIDVWKKVICKIPGYKLSIIGDGPLKEILNEKIIKNNLQDSILLEGEKIDIKNEYLSSDLYVMTSRYEGFPMVLLEAQSCGLPIVTFQCCPGISIIVENKKNGYIVEDFNIDDFSDKVVNILQDKIKLKNMSEQARISSHRFKVEEITKKWILLFDELL